MYCEKCKKQSPDHFKNCIYCGAPFPPEKSRAAKKKPKNHLWSRIPFKNRVTGFMILAVVLALAAILCGFFSGRKPDRVVCTMLKATISGNAEKYCSVFEKSIFDYETKNVYFDRAATVKALSAPMTETDKFYREKCGDGYSLHYRVTSVSYLSDAELAAENKKLAEDSGCTKKAGKGAKIDVTVTAKGKRGSYDTVYKDLLCLRYGFEWYRLPDTAA